MVENLEKDSGLFDEQWENNLHEIRKHCQKTGLPAWNIPQKKGFFRNLNVRKSYKHDKLLIELVTSSTDIKKLKKTVQFESNSITSSKQFNYQHNFPDK